MKISPIDKSKLATTGREFISLISSDADWFARNKEDVKSLRGAGVGPFAKIPERDFNTFVESLVFKVGGVATGTYRPLMFSLTLTEIFEVYQYFGMAPLYALEIHEAICDNSAWRFEFWSFCSASCPGAQYFEGKK